MTFTQKSQALRVVKSTYYGNWGDQIGYPLASWIVKPLSRISWLTPNHVTIVSFALFALGCVFLVVDFPYHLLAAGLMIFVGYVGDDVDGQLARITKKYSLIGDYLDKVLDILKIFLVTFFSGLAAYLQTDNVLYLVLGFVACFMFQYRYYIRLETQLGAVDRNPGFWEAARSKRKELEHEMDVLYAKRAASVKEALQILWVKNRTIFLVDEAEFAIFTSIGAFFNRLDLSIIVLAVAQTAIVTWRLYERGVQVRDGSNGLLPPVRK